MCRWLVALCVLVGCDPAVSPVRLPADATVIEMLPPSPVAIGSALLLDRGPQVRDRLTSTVGDEDFVYEIDRVDDDEPIEGCFPTPRHVVTRIDRERINIDEEPALRDWSAKLGVTSWEVKAAVRKVGPVATDVARALGHTTRN